jgi:hypothetical protein
VVNKNRICYLGDHNCTWTQSGVPLGIIPISDEGIVRILSLPFSLGIRIR